MHLKEIINFGNTGNDPHKALIDLSKFTMARMYKNGNATTHICVDTDYHYWIKEPIEDVYKWLAKAGIDVYK